MRQSRQNEKSGQLGEFEQLVLLATLQRGDDARAREIRSCIEGSTRRPVSRGALYATLDRLVDKGLLDWDVEESTPARGGLPSRRFRVTPEGLAALRRSYRAVMKLASGLEDLLGRV